MQKINIHAAKTHLSALVDRAAAGEPFVIAKAGRPLVTVIPYRETPLIPRTGFLKEGNVPPDFNHMMADEISEMFEGPP
jgi:prevent-host-death family protein